MLERFFPSLPASYTWFLYLGVVLFMSHLFLFGFGLDLSYFGLLLIYIGLAKPGLYTWFRHMLWFFILLDIIANIRAIYDRMTKWSNKSNKKVVVKDVKKESKKSVKKE